MPTDPMPGAEYAVGQVFQALSESVRRDIRTKYEL
jgi:hypothetical protein